MRVYIVAYLERIGSFARVIVLTDEGTLEAIATRYMLNNP
jgi:hypothetical protein